MKMCWLLVMLMLLCTAQAGESEHGAELNITKFTKDATTELAVESIKIRAPWVRTYSTAPGLHVIAGNAVQWIVYNFDKVEGWSLSGYAKITIDRQFRPRRWKFGIVNDPGSERTGMWNTWDRFHGRRDLGICFGINFTGEF